MSVLRAAALVGLRQAVRRGKLVVTADPVLLARASEKGKLAIDARAVAAALLAAEPGVMGDALDLLPAVSQGS